MKTIALPEDLHKELLQPKQENRKNTAELINKLITEYKRQRFFNASKLFRNAMKKRNINFPSLLKKSRKIREELADEWF